MIATDLLHFNWYQENLHSIYPALVIPVLFPWPETIVIASPSHEVCHAGYADASEIRCPKPLASR
jgi:hypothetical protein